MFEALIITFREGLEAFLIVAITLAYLNKTGRGHLNKAVFAGIIGAIAISATTGWHIKDLANDPLMEGALAMTAGILVATLTVMMMRTAKNVGKAMTDKLENHAARGGIAALTGVFLFTVLMIAREGMELTLMLGAMTSYLTISTIAAGGALGFAAVGLIGFLWVSQSAKINLKLFMQVTGVFLILFAIHLVLLGFHEFSEVAAIPFVDNALIQRLTEPFGHGSVYAQLVTYSLLVVPCAWILAAYAKEKFFPHAPVAAK